MNNEYQSNYTPSKIRVFLWRLARHSIPTTDVLHRRNMATQIVCPLCGCGDSWRHALLSCTMSRCIWALTEETIVTMMTEHAEPSAKNWLFELHEALNHGSFTKLVVTLWAVWYARRKAIYESLYQNPHQTISFVESYLQELQQIPTCTPRVQVIAAPAQQRRWIPPPAGVVKINVDGALARNSRVGVAAAICRDSNGAFLGSSTIVF